MNNLINILGKEGHIEDVIKMFNEMSSLHCTPNVVTYNIVIKALFESRSPASEAATWFEKMKVNGIVPNVYAYNALISGIMRADMIDEAHSLLKVMEENDCILDLNSHNIIFNGLARTGGPNQDLEKFSKTKHSKIELDELLITLFLVV
ncbi:hypothetical protein ACFX11_046724 [Malus domestica]